MKQFRVIRTYKSGAFSYLTVQIAATLKFGALDKVTAQIVIRMTSAGDLRKTFTEVPANHDKQPMATDSVAYTIAESVKPRGAERCFIGYERARSTLPSIKLSWC